MQFGITPAKLVTSVGVRRLPSLLEIITLKCVLEALFVRFETILPIHDYSAVERVHMELDGDRARDAGRHSIKNITCIRLVEVPNYKT